MKTTHFLLLVALATLASFHDSDTHAKTDSTHNNVAAPAGLTSTSNDYPSTEVSAKSDTKQPAAEDSPEASTQDDAFAATRQKLKANAEGIAFFSGGESGSLASERWRVELLPEPYEQEAAVIINNKVLAGSKAIQIKWKKDWPLRGGKIRSELKRPGGIMLYEGSEYWLGMAFYIEDTPGHRYIMHASDINAHVFQWHNTSIPGTNGIKMRNGQITLHFGKEEELNEVAIADMELGTWHRLVINLRLSKEKDGFLRLWHNAESETDLPAIDYVGPTINDSAINPKMGIYRWHGMDWGSAQELVQIYDEYRIGTEDASFAAVKPRASPL